jgi:hypothetical protein
MNPQITPSVWSTNREPRRLGVATGSGKCQVHRHCKLAFPAIDEMEMLFIASTTSSLPRGVGVLYSSTHNRRTLRMLYY